MATFYADSDLAGAGEFVEPEIWLAGEFTVPAGTASFRWRWPAVAPVVTPQVRVFNASGALVAGPIAFDSSTLSAWNTAGANSPIALSAGTYRVTVNTNRYPARSGFFSGGSITRGFITGVQSRFGAVGNAPASTSAATYFIDIDFTPSSSTETFTGTDGAAWPLPWSTVSGTSSIQSGRGQQTSPTTAYTSAENRANVTASNVRVDTTVRFPAVGNGSQRINIRWNPFTGNGYRLLMPTDYAGFQLLKVTAYVESPIQEEFSTVWAAGVDYRVAFEATGTTIRAKRWLAGNSEPGAWALSGTDATYASGDVSLVTVNAAAGGAFVGTWDDTTIVVSQPAGTTINGTSALTSASALTGSASSIRQASASVASPSGLTAAASVRVSRSASMTSASALSASTTTAVSAAASPASVSTVSAVASVAVRAAAGLSSISGMTAVVGGYNQPGRFDSSTVAATARGRESASTATASMWP